MVIVTIPAWLAEQARAHSLPNDDLIHLQFESELRWETLYALVTAIERECLDSDGRMLEMEHWPRWATVPLMANGLLRKDPSETFVMLTTRCGALYAITRAARTLLQMPARPSPERSLTSLVIELGELLTNRSATRPARRV
jgi:hypothetical protein